MIIFSLNQGKLLATNDGGSNWETLNSNASEDLVDVFFLSPLSGWLLPKNGPLITINEQFVSTPAKGPRPILPKVSSPGFPNSHSIAFTSSRRGWIVGNNGEIHYTQDGGRTWKKQDSKTQSNLLRAQFESVQQGWIVGEEGIILYTDTGGNTWQSQSSGTSVRLSHIKIPDNQSAFVLGDKGTILRTNNRGKTWLRAQTDTEEQIVDAAFVNEQQGWAVGTQGAILYTGDGGKSWTRQESGTRSNLFVVNVQKDKVIIIGEDGIILRHILN